jgi:membrane-associated protein
VTASASAGLAAIGPSWLDPQHLSTLGAWAPWVAAAIIFAECGLLVGFFFPGDSLLFTLGVFIGTGAIGMSLPLACLLIAVAAFAGNVVGYEIGRAAGPAIFSRQDSRLFRREYVDKTAAFFERYGNRAIVLARFVPIVRTFITVTAGIAHMDRRRYLTYSGIGAVLWAVVVTLLGYFLGSVAFVRNNIEVILVLIVAVSVVPIVVEILRERAKSRREEPQAQPVPEDAERPQR